MQSSLNHTNERLTTICKLLLFLQLCNYMNDVQCFFALWATGPILWSLKSWMSSPQSGSTSEQGSNRWKTDGLSPIDISFALQWHWLLLQTIWRLCLSHKIFRVQPELLRTPAKTYKMERGLRFLSALLNSGFLPPSLGKTSGMFSHVPLSWSPSPILPLRTS